MVSFITMAILLPALAELNLAALVKVIFAESEGTSPTKVPEVTVALVVPS